MSPNLWMWTCVVAIDSSSSLEGEVVGRGCTGTTAKKFPNLTLHRWMGEWTRRTNEPTIGFEFPRGWATTKAHWVSCPSSHSSSSSWLVIPCTFFTLGELSFRMRWPWMTWNLYNRREDAGSAFHCVLCSVARSVLRETHTRRKSWPATTRTTTVDHVSTRPVIIIIT